MKKYKVVYEVETKTTDLDRNIFVLQRLLPNEIHLIKTMLNNGLVIMGIRKVEYSPEMYKMYFG
jgi:hypothetical protein